MADKKDNPTGSPFPEHPMCKCTLYGIDEETTAILDAIALDIDRQFMKDLRSQNPGDMIAYYENLEGHFERRH